MLSLIHISIAPATGELVEGGIEEQTKQSLENIKAILEEAGSGMDKVVKTTCFLTDMNNLSLIHI